LKEMGYKIMYVGRNRKIMVDFSDVVSILTVNNNNDSVIESNSG